MLKMKKLYNQDGSLCSEAQLLLYPKPEDISMAEWRKRLKNFRVQLSAEDLKEFNVVKAEECNANWRAKNPERVKKIKALWFVENFERVKQNSVNWRAKNPERVKQNTVNWKAKNPEYTTAYNNTYHKQRKAKDPLYRLHCNMRSMGNRVVKQLALGKKPANTFTWVGCTAEELKTRFESLFTEGMTWENYGEWHVDHIRPVSSFAPEEWEQINHYTNLQPLWAKDNLLKGDSWEQ